MFDKIKELFENWLYEKETLTIGEFNNRLKFQECEIYSDDKLKFIEQATNLHDYYVESDTGYSKILKSHKTVKYLKYTIHLENGMALSGADTHILMNSNLDELFIKDAKIGDSIYTKTGASKISNIVNSHEYENMCDLELDDENHRYYTNGILSHNSITVAAYILHYILFNAETTTVILANKAATAREILSRIKRMFENLPSFLQTGVKEYNKGSIILANDATLLAAATSSDSIRGLSVNMLFLDEFAFVDNADEFMEGVYPTIASGKKSKVIITSTPNGMNLFYKIYDEAMRGVNSFHPTRVDYWEVPRYDEEWKLETIRNIGQRRFDQEFGNTFAGSGLTLISGEKLAALTWTTPLEETEMVSIYENPNPDHQYVITVDVSEGAGYDYSVISVFDVTNRDRFEQVAKLRGNLIDPEILPELIVGMATNYNMAMVLVESNSIGSKVCYILYYELEYENVISTAIKQGKSVISGGFAKSADIGVRTTKKTKSIGCSTLKSMIENDILKINDFDTVTELMGFIKVGQSYEAGEKSTDDIVMTLVIFAWFTSQSYFSDLTDTNISNTIRTKLKDTIEETLIPFGEIDDGLYDDYATAETVLYDSVFG